VRTGTSQRPTLLNELECSASIVLTVYTIPYPQGHTGLQREGNPSASTPFLFDKDDASPVYSLMHQTFSDNRQRNHLAEASAVPMPAAPDTEEKDTAPPFTPIPRTFWASDQEARDMPLQWQRVILIQDNTDTGFTQAPIRAGQGPTRTMTLRNIKAMS